MGYLKALCSLPVSENLLLLWGEALNALKRVPSERHGTEEVFFSINKGKIKFAYKVETRFKT